MGITLFPWQMVCSSHPFGHEHHHHVEGEPSTCELHRIYANADGQHILPPMECEHISSQIDDFNQTQREIIATNQMVAIVSVVFDLVSSDNQQEPFLIPPEPNCRSATLLSDSHLRAPPLV